MSVKAFLLEVASAQERDEKFVDFVLTLLAQPGRLRCSMLACALAKHSCDVETTEVEHMANVNVLKVSFDGEASPVRMGFMVSLCECR